MQKCTKKRKPNPRVSLHLTAALDRRIMILRPLVAEERANEVNNYGHGRADQHTEKPADDNQSNNSDDALLVEARAVENTEDEELGDGTYGYMFEFLAPTGESALSEIAVFNIEGGNITTLAE